MIESYQLEIIRKHRAARLFWLVVFVCALFLYYFFQGYYPDVSLGMRRIFSESGSQSSSGSSDLIKSFGIINVKTTPIDATILLGSGSYGNNEKKMSDYGNYTMQVYYPGYLANTMEFQIDREKPFFIEKVSLLPRPTYRELPRIIELYQVADDEYITRTASGLAWSGATASGKVSYSGVLTYIGGRYFQSSTGVLKWGTGKFERATADISNFVATCPQIEWRYGVFSCPQAKSLLTEVGRYMTGVLDIRDHLIAQSGSITEISGGNTGKSWGQTGGVDLTRVAIMNGVFYTNSSGTLTPRDQTEEKILTTLDIITHISSLGDDIVSVGIKQGESHLIIRHSGDPLDRTREIILPENLSYRDIEFHSLDGNIMIETDGGILFVYRGSHEIVWIVEGEIFSYASE